MDELYKGTGGKPPASSPKPATGKTVYVVTCSSATPACLLPAQAAQEAGKSLGIDVKIVDGMYNAAGAWSSGIRTALATDPDGMILIGVACPAAQQALEEAKTQGVTVMGFASMDCAETGGPQLFTAPMIYNDTIKTGKEWFEAMGQISADYIINETGGDAKIIYTAGSDPQQAAGDEAFREELKKCEKCEIVATVPYSSPDLVANGPWIQGLRTALVQHPDANSVYLEWDVMSNVLGGLQAVKESGLKVVTFGGEGAPDTYESIRNGDQTALTKVKSLEWAGYAFMDNMNRALQGEPTVPQGLGHTITDKDHNLPDSTDFDGGLDFKAAYQQAWEQAAG
jgi:ribose transport system substrate-binding protein